jgi:trafficking protein particle complex subunit 12
MGLLLLRIGDISAARELLHDSSETVGMLAPLLATAEGRYEDAVREWDILRDESQGSPLQSITQQNLAVNYLYSGRLKDARRLMEDAVENGEGYGSLTFNLATVYELSSDKSRDLKMSLVSRVASQDGSRMKSWAKTNANFKL